MQGTIRILPPAVGRNNCSNPSESLDTQSTSFVMKTGKISRYCRRRRALWIDFVARSNRKLPSTSTHQDKYRRGCAHLRWAVSRNRKNLHPSDCTPVVKLHPATAEICERVAQTLKLMCGEMKTLADPMTVCADPMKVCAKMERIMEPQ